MIGRIHTIRAGTTGTPVLLLHGIGGAAQSFRAQLPALAARYRAVAWDAPGYGASADPAAAPSMSGYAALAASLLAGLLRAHVVGVSWGGVIATRLAVNHPDRVRSLTLADSSRGSARTPAGAAAMRARAAQLADLGVDEFARRRALRLVAPTLTSPLWMTFGRPWRGCGCPGTALPPNPWPTPTTVTCCPGSRCRRWLWSARTTKSPASGRAADWPARFPLHAYGCLTTPDTPPTSSARSNSTGCCWTFSTRWTLRDGSVGRQDGHGDQRRSLAVRGRRARSAPATSDQPNCGGLLVQVVRDNGADTAFGGVTGW